MAILVDNGIEKGDMKSIWFYSFLMLVAAFVSLWAGAKSGKHAAIASSGFAKNLRKAEYHNIQNFSFSNIDAYSTSGLITRMMTDVTNIQNAYQMMIRVCVRAPLMLIASLVMAFIINKEMAMIFVAAVLVLGVILYIKILVSEQGNTICEKT
ncbi:ABC transporter transmembrane domain-containing protein, partial [Holdemanella biformis]|uniref:ABC transporter transmembrane domain-containing protein n=1 Tax=Holdemanella biformis TaxID=1735 RepID=UPI002491E2C9